MAISADVKDAGDAKSAVDSDPQAVSADIKDAPGDVKSAVGSDPQGVYSIGSSFRFHTRDDFNFDFLKQKQNGSQSNPQY
jgi:hypothetical protein